MWHWPTIAFLVSSAYWLYDTKQKIGKGSAHGQLELLNLDHVRDPKHSGADKETDGEDARRARYESWFPPLPGT